MVTASASASPLSVGFSRYYVPQLKADEAIIFKQFDSTTSESKVCIHTACEIEEEGFPQPLPARKSVEVPSFGLHQVHTFRRSFSLRQTLKQSCRNLMLY